MLTRISHNKCHFRGKTARSGIRESSDRVGSSSLRCLRISSLLSWELFAYLQFAPAQLASAHDPKHDEKRVAQGTQQDETANERALRDAAGLLTIEGTVVDQNGSPVPNARVQLQASMEWSSKTLSDAKGRFRFRFVDVPTARFLTFTAENRRDGTKGYLSLQEEGTLGFPAPVEIVLKPPHEIVIEVNDRTGAPVAGALVEISHSLDEDRTGPDGMARFRLPADAKIGQVIALKSGAGFDYWTDRVDRNADPRPLPPKLVLTLNGARTVRVKAIDSLGQPVSGIRVVPWIVAKQGHGHYANSPGYRSQLESMRTDSNGVVTIDWLPVDLSRGLTFLAGSRDFHLPRPPSYEPGPKDEVADLTMELLRATKISGTVYQEDGKPAPGIVLQAEGRGDTNHYFRDLARTNADGAFEFKAYPNQAYLVSVLDENWAASSCTVARVLEDQPIRALEFRLNRGTVLRGVVTTADGNIRANTTVTLVQTASLADVAKIPQLVRWARTDAQGRYHFRVGPGSYELIDPDHKSHVPLHIFSEQEVVRDFREGQ
jgi:protocatechuate 3,4-dioxygenase beta subunit